MSGAKKKAKVPKAPKPTLQQCLRAMAEYLPTLAWEPVQRNVVKGPADFAGFLNALADYEDGGCT